ncbi:MAG: heat-inducible transcription repressor HrcA [Clostridia bacterium]|nr:heat-inducible transcription repressor HrcA [Clostridia bacterium]
MELTQRKRAILAEIVKMYIETGEPIGSKLLATRLEDSPSTATLRAEMCELEKLGYLKQPHTSAGRFPTSRAYRLYVNELMARDGISGDSRELIDRMLVDINPEPESIGSAAAQILTTLTGLPAVYAENVENGTIMKKVTVLPMGRAAVIIFAITGDGRSRSRLVPYKLPLSEENIALFMEIAEKNICKKRLCELNKAYLQSLTAAAGLEALSLAPLFAALFDMAEELGRTKINMRGESKLFSALGSETSAKDVLRLFSSTDTAQSILSSSSDTVGVVFGDDTEFEELKPTGMIIASYGGQSEFRRLAVIGPTRMSYERILPSVEYLAGQIGKIMQEMLKGLEE